ncbi:DNA-binding MarR family transcriptional regulator [Agromyces hippuratus]|uniref:DNA-binding MarR family transcriptional regulator n=1 Tax=Agromyces hippuratus TaxID=286438 RepID=A0A852WV94_9MICO|nr:MarR family transcriptional regulator [Agromyces hippuratus]NYG21577.1 DNA-binding MarR family transcriptional regulator [Agromyces hippuratus]
MAQHPPGELPILLIGSFREVIDELHEQLRELGFEDLRPLHGFALQSIAEGGVSISEFARRLGVTKQAAARTAASMESLGLVDRHVDPDDARASVITRTPRANDFLAASGRLLGERETEWRRQLGADRYDTMISCLQQLRAAEPFTTIPGWLGRTTRI